MRTGNVEGREIMNTIANADFLDQEMFSKLVQTRTRVFFLIFYIQVLGTRDDLETCIFKFLEQEIFLNLVHTNS